MIRHLLLVLFLAVPFQVHAQTFHVPFHSVKSYILLDTTVDHRPAVLILDTGSPVSFTRNGKALELHGSGFRTASSILEPVTTRQTLLSTASLARMS